MYNTYQGQQYDSNNTYRPLDSVTVEPIPALPEIGFFRQQDLDYVVGQIEEYREMLYYNGLEYTVDPQLMGILDMLLSFKGMVVQGEVPVQRAAQERPQPVQFRQPNLPNPSLPANQQQQFGLQTYGLTASGGYGENGSGTWPEEPPQFMNTNPAQGANPNTGSQSHRASVIQNQPQQSNFGNATFSSVQPATTQPNVVLNNSQNAPQMPNVPSLPPNVTPVSPRGSVHVPVILTPLRPPSTESAARASTVITPNQLPPQQQNPALMPNPGQPVNQPVNQPVLQQPQSNPNPNGAPLMDVTFQPATAEPTKERPTSGSEHRVSPVNTNPREVTATPQQAGTASVGRDERGATNTASPQAPTQGTEKGGEKKSNHMLSALSLRGAQSIKRTLTINPDKMEALAGEAREQTERMASNRGSVDPTSRSAREGRKHTMDSSRVAGISEFTMAKASGLKKGELVLNKQTYFCWVGQSKLFYATNEMDDAPKGEVSFANYDEVQIVNGNQFQLLDSQSGKTVAFGTYSKENVSSWASAIAKAHEGMKTTNANFTFQSETHSLYLVYVKIFTAKEIAGAHNTFCAVSSNGEEKGRTPVIYNTASPDFYHPCTFSNGQPISEFSITIYDVRADGSTLSVLGQRSFALDWSVLRLKDEHPILWSDVYSPTVGKPRALNIEVGRNKAGKVTLTFKNLVGAQKDKTYRVIGYTEKEPAKSPSPMHTSLADLPSQTNQATGAQSPQQPNSPNGTPNTPWNNANAGNQSQPQSPTSTQPIQVTQPARKDTKSDAVSGSPSLSSLPGKRNINTKTKVSRGGRATMGPDEQSCMFEARDGNFKSSCVMELDSNDTSTGRAIRIDCYECNDAVANAEDILFGTLLVPMEEWVDCGRQLTKKLTPTVVGTVRLEYWTNRLDILADGAYDDLFQLLVADEFAFCRILRKGAVPEATKPFGQSLVRACELKRTAGGIIKALLRDEIKEQNSLKTLFRLDSLASATLEYYLRFIAMPQLHKAFHAFVVDIIKYHSEGGKRIEIDPTRLAEAEAGEDTKKGHAQSSTATPRGASKMDKTIKKNAARLEKFCQTAFQRALELRTTLPLIVRVIFCDMNKHLMEQFNGDKTAGRTAICSFLFLRFIIPVIVHPDQFQIISTTPKGDVERTLVLIGKVLQKLSNEREFGSDGKEPWMIPMNEFLKKNRPALQSFLDDMLVIPNTKIDAMPIDHSTINYGTEMAYNLAYIGDAITKIISDGKEPVTNEHIQKFLALKENLTNKATILENNL